MTQKTTQRRSLKNVVLTRKHHIPYMGLTIALSLGLRATFYGLLLFELFALGRSGSDAPLRQITVLVTVMVGLLGLGVIGTGVLAAHRVAGVHIKMKSVFKSIADGDLETVLRFRKEDKLPHVEESFNKMMTVIRKRIEQGQGEALTET